MCVCGGDTQIETRAWPSPKMLDPFGIPHIGAPQTPSYELSTAKQILPRGMALWDQVIQLNNTCLIQTPGRPMLLIFICASHHVRFDTRSFLKWGLGEVVHELEIHVLLVIGSPGLKARCKGVIACHRFTKCNVNLGLSMIPLTWLEYQADHGKPEGEGLCY